MYASRVKHNYSRLRKRRICQGDILRDHSISLGGGDYDATEIDLPYSVVMTQDCDLEQDFNDRTKNTGNDKHLVTILVCPAYQADIFFRGEHIPSWSMQLFNAKQIDKIKKNDEYKRYHYLKGFTPLGIPELVVDFKHFYTVSRDIVYKERRAIYLSTISELFREDLSHRFSNYLSRIGLPDL